MTDVQPRTDAEIQQDRTGSTSTRRVVLMGAGGLGMAAALGACSTDSSGTNPNGTDFNNNPVPAGSEGTEAGSTGAGSGSAGGTVLVAASKVAVGGGVILDDLVVTQPSEGTFKAFSKLCTHQGCPVSKIQGGQIKCTCHNSDFSIETGAPTAGPAQKPLTETPVTLDGDNVVMA
ncbi:Rieske (2Fe-2S) protein [Actinoplanes xinjiangensis]|uniref:Nitrite reductase/ring-hydroxylating ferredoxin subunit n=1 Tax=Actinoplanes xinjiangensis TaxID=512350 RepID=A0A316EIB7_9ACTN|nr:Rieske (2Fe-2S) protein [Actinoplanes xinjiangensis]PWK29572.1 nitrite reductase/ring-hydroxylating ferredoxin subunit [Actinoplanes xinjiangensis]GIF44928.1 iron-sulfur protein [Actinoplanes xinjiangensis]